MTMMARIFKKHLRTRVKKWYSIALPVKKYLEAVDPDKQSILVARLRALELISSIHLRSSLLLKHRFMTLLIQEANLNKIDGEREESINEKLGILNQQNTLFDEVRFYKE